MTIRIFRHYWQLPLAMLALADALISYGSFFFAWTLISGPFVAIGTAAGPFPVRQGLLFSCTLFVCFAAMGLYSARQRSNLIGLLTRIILGVGAAALIVGLLSMLPIARDMVVDSRIRWISVLFTLIGCAMLRFVSERVISEDAFKRCVLVYGSGNRAASIARLRRRSDRRGFTVAGFVPAVGDDSGKVPQDKILSSSKSLLEQCLEQDANEIVVAMDDRRRQFPMDQLLECRLAGIEIIDLVSFLERETGKVWLELLHPSWMIFSTGFRRTRINSALERTSDILASLILLGVTWPVMLLTTLAIKLEEGLSAPVFYRQVRVGQRGRQFGLMKFRSMRADAESDGQARWAQQNDSRVTKVGAVIRKTRIDELPQILNVLKGEMSFVGPRPERPEFVSHLSGQIPYYAERHVIKPGITGWAQLCYPYGSSERDAAEKLQYDLFYVKNHSPIFYWAILIQTVEVIVWSKGAR